MAHLTTLGQPTTNGRQITRIWFPPPSEDCAAVTAEDVIAAAAEIGLILTRPDPTEAWLLDPRGQSVFWHLTADTLVLSTFPTATPTEGITHGLSYAI